MYRHCARDRTGSQPVVTVTVLTAFVAYATWAAFVEQELLRRAPRSHRDLISPFYSPCLTGSCVPGSALRARSSLGGRSRPALLILIFPLGFRLTCYYYRKAYYRGFWQSPPACAVADGHGTYTGETRFPLSCRTSTATSSTSALVFNVILTIDAVVAFRLPGESASGSAWAPLVLVVNATLLWLYSLQLPRLPAPLRRQVLNSSPSTPIRYRIWKAFTPLNAQHMQFAWVSLASWSPSPTCTCGWWPAGPSTTTKIF